MVRILYPQPMQHLLRVNLVSVEMGGDPGYNRPDLNLDEDDTILDFRLAILD